MLIDPRYSTLATVHNCRLSAVLFLNIPFPIIKYPNISYNPNKKWVIQGQKKMFVCYGKIFIFLIIKENEENNGIKIRNEIF